MPSAAELRRRRADLVRRAHRCRSPLDVFAVASDDLRPLVAFDAAAWLGTDPGTGLPTSPVRIDDLTGVTQALCAEHWQRELLEDDVNTFRHLARADTPAASLRAAIDEPERSPRFRRFLRPLGLHDELRTVLRVGGGLWGLVTLWRRRGSPPFTARDAAVLASLSAPVGEALRRHARPVAARSGDDPDRPGLLLFAPDGRVVSADDAARHWLAELPDEPGVRTAHGMLPLWLLITVYRAAAVRHGAGDGTARTRARTRRGRWIACHASCLRDAGGSAADVALVIEPAPPSTVAPLLVEAYDLTEREQQIVQLVARGDGTTDIADELFLSRHTVRDHVKAIFAKVGVSSRGELVAKLYAEHYEPLHQQDVTRLNRT